MSGLYTGATGLWGGFAGLLYGSSALSTPPGLLADATGVNPFSPASLFANSEPGFWFDPSDFSTMFQDVEGTIAVTATEQPVALIRDKSKSNTGSPLGSELITNGDFSVSTGWTLGTSWSISSGTASRALNASLTYISQPVSFSANKTYLITFTITAISGGSVFPRITGGTNISGTSYSTTGTFSQVIKTVSGNNTFNIGANANVTVTIDNVSVKEIVTTDAICPTSTSRPVLKQDVNGKYYLAFDGVDDYLVTGSITFSPSTAVSICAGVYRATDVASVYAEGNTSINSGSGKFTLRSDATVDFSFISRGTISSTAGTTATYTPPTTAVLTGLGDIPGDIAILRFNGSQVAQSTTDQGTGGFGIDPYFIGMRAGTTVALNGGIYGMIVVGKFLAGSELTNTETWMNANTGAY